MESIVVKSFSSLIDAERFVAGENPSQNGGSGASPTARFYAVKNGRIPGIYADWPSAQEQITGWQKPKHRCFSTRAEAQRFLDQETSVSEGSPEAPAVEPQSFFDSNDADGPPDTTIQPPAQKRPKNVANGSSKSRMHVPEYNQEDYEAGCGPLPLGAEDGFDPNIYLDPETGKLAYKTDEQRQATKPAPGGGTHTSPIRIHTDGSALGNGGAGAFAGVGVYFGPADKRYSI